jgi:glycosyltransferase involved in cell wall biosynthesis
MRVLHVHSGNLYGGIETFLVTLARCRHLCPAMEMSVALCFDGRLNNELSAAGVPVDFLGEVRISRPRSVWQARRALANLLKQNPADVVICHEAWAQAIFGPVARSAGLPLVFWLHAVGDGRHWLDRWARTTRPDLTVCNSKFTASALARLHPGAPVERVHYPVVDAEPHEPAHNRDAARAELQTPCTDVVIIQVSRMEAWKGHQTCLEGLAMLRDVPGWTCWQVGGAQRRQEERYLERLRAFATQHGIESRVRFLGERTDVPRLLRAADIYCQPNTAPESFGITFVEALSAGIPVVTTAMGGALEIVDETCGLLVPPRDAPALAAVLRRLLEDEALRIRLGRQARIRRRELCDPATQLRRIGEMLANLIHSGSVVRAPAAS